MNFNKKQKGFSLIELMLAIGIISIGLVSLLNYNARVAQITRAESAGEQLAEVGKALGNYISRESGALQACLAPNATIQLNDLNIISSSTGTTTSGTCTLSNRQFITPNSDNNLFGVQYRLLIQKTASNNLTGLVLSSAPIRDPASPTIVRYDWIGAAMKKAGASSGMTFTGEPNSMKGLGGGWELTNTNFALINQVGLIGYRISYQGTYDDIYLRLDGAYPMQGNLNMGNYNINNATDINFNGWLNGNNALLNNLKTGYISNSGNIQTDTLSATTSIVTGGRESSLGNNRPFGWTLDYIQTGNIYAQGQIATGVGGSGTLPGTINASMNSDGLITAKNIYLDPIRCDDTSSPGYSTLQSANCSNKDEHAGLLTDRLPQYVSRGAQVVDFTDLSVPGYNWVQKPVCGSGSYPKIIVTPQIHNLYPADNANMYRLRYDTSTNVYSLYVPNFLTEQIQVYAIDVPSANRWEVILSTANAESRGLIEGAKALAQTFCDYGRDIRLPPLP